MNPADQHLIDAAMSLFWKHVTSKRFIKAYREMMRRIANQKPELN